MNEIEDVVVLDTVVPVQVPVSAILVSCLPLLQTSVEESEL